VICSASAAPIAASSDTVFASQGQSLPGGALFNDVKSGGLFTGIALTSALAKCIIGEDAASLVGRLETCWVKTCDAALACRDSQLTAGSALATIVDALVPLNTEVTRRAYLDARGRLRDRLEKLHHSLYGSQPGYTLNEAKAYRVLLMARVDNNLSWIKKKKSGAGVGACLRPGYPPRCLTSASRMQRRLTARRPQQVQAQSAVALLSPEAAPAPAGRAAPLSAV